jgi:hypothetical protein
MPKIRRHRGRLPPALRHTTATPIIAWSLLISLGSPREVRIPGGEASYLRGANQDFATISARGTKQRYHESAELLESNEQRPCCRIVALWRSMQAPSSVDAISLTIAQ